MVCDSELLVVKCRYRIHRVSPPLHSISQASAALLPRVGARWAAETADLLAALQGRAQGPIDALFEAWYLELKSLRRLLAQGFPADARSLACPPAIVESLPVLIGALRAMAGSLSSAPAARGAVKLWKTILQLQERHPWCAGDCEAARNEGFRPGTGLRFSTMPQS